VNHQSQLRVPPTLKRYRTRQPINGVIMTISIADLLSDSAEARFAQLSCSA
jgi:type VI secretion system protein ImpL